VKPKFRLAATGGTFDRLHRGHKILLRRAFTLSNRVIIGLTTDPLAKRLHKPHHIDPYRARRKTLVAFLKRLRALSRAKIVALHDRYGPTVANANIEAIVVSYDTLRTARQINRMRRRRNLRPLRIVVVDTVPAEDLKPISTTRIRKGVIDREGYLILDIRKIGHS